MTREDVIAKAHSFAKSVPFEEGGLSAHIRPLMAGERVEAQAWQKVHGDDAGYQFLFVRSVCDADGKRMFSDDDAPLVATFPVPMVEAVLSRVMELNRMGDHEKKVPSTTIPTSDSPSA